MKSGKFVSLRRFTGLPFEMSEIGANLHLVCPHCFLGGPNSGSVQLHTNLYELTGAGKLYAKAKK